MGWRTSLRRSEVLARRWSARPGAACLLNAQRPALIDLTLQFVLGSVRLFWSHHLHEAKATALTAMRVPHDVALLNNPVLLKELGDLPLVETRMDAGDEEVRARVCCVFIIVRRWVTGNESALTLSPSPKWQVEY